MNLENKQLLLVEDEEEICAQVASYFAEDEALSLMDVVQDGSVDREQLAKADVVVLDLIIPSRMASACWNRLRKCRRRLARK